MATLVKFRKNNESEAVYAFFPQLNYNSRLYGNKMKVSYEHYGQHGGCHIDYYKESDKLREAMQAGTPPERSQFEKLTTDRDEKLKKFLSADQFKKFKDELEPALRPQRGNRK